MAAGEAELHQIPEHLSLPPNTILVFSMDFACVLLIWYVGDATESSSLFTEGPLLRAEEVVLCLRTWIP